MTNIVYNEDCMIGMARYPDKYFDLAIVDPPYGINITKKGLGLGGGEYRKPKKYIINHWDENKPDTKYFEELKRISKNQIIWGGNYFKLNPSPCFIVWDKNNGDSDFADCELAWTSFDSPIRKFFFTWSGFIQQKNGKNKETRIHPTQKPVALYTWLLKKYSKSTDKILDTHVGSGSSRIAADKAGLDFIGFEIDKDYWEAQEKRYQTYKLQLKLAL